MPGYHRKRVHQASLVLEGSLMVESLEWTMFKHPARQEFWTLEVRARERTWIFSYMRRM
jgi:hypothetical protein